MIEINNDISLKCFDKNTDMWFIDEIKGNSKSNMIHQVDERLLLSKEVDELVFDNAYLINYNGDIVGYAYVSNNSKGYYYYEQLLLKDFRKKGLGSYILEALNDYIFMNNDRVKECRLSIDRSNLPSILSARKSGFFENDEDYSSEKVDFLKDNPYYINRKR